MSYLDSRSSLVGSSVSSFLLQPSTRRQVEHVHLLICRIHPMYKIHEMNKAVLPTNAPYVLCNRVCYLGDKSFFTNLLPLLAGSRVFL